jgi:hypothetical protein
MAGHAFALRHFSEQYFTSSQFFSQALRHVKSRPQIKQGLVGKKLLLPLNDEVLFTTR